MESGSNERKALTHTPTIEAYFTYTSRKKLILHILVRKGKIFSLPNNKPASKKLITTQPVRALRKPKLLLSSGEFLFKTTPPNFLLSSIKRMLSFFVLHTCLWFAIVCVSSTAILLLFLKKLIFSG